MSEERNGNVMDPCHLQAGLPEEDTLTHCYHCGQALPSNAERCSNCGRRQQRVCYCGQRVPVTVEVCPHCGADWSGSRRVRRKSRRPHRVKPRVVLRSALIGAGVSLVLMVAAHILVKYFARIGGDGSLPPSDVMMQLDLAAEGARRVLSSWETGFQAQAGTLGSLLIGLMIGAGIGIIGYLTSVGILHLSDNNDKSKRRRRSSRTPDA